MIPTPDVPLVIAFAKLSSHVACKDSPRSSMDEHTDEMYRTEEADARMQVC